MSAKEMSGIPIAGKILDEVKKDAAVTVQWVAKLIL